MLDEFSELAIFLGAMLSFGLVYWGAELSLFKFYEARWARRSRRAAIEACSCPHAPGKRLVLPRCPVERRSVANREELVIKGAPHPECQAWGSIGNGYVCTCSIRAAVFRHHGV